MANSELFKSAKNKAQVTNATNNAGGQAYSFSAKHHLAQLACTGFFGNTYYVDANTQLKEVLELASQVEDEFVAKVAVYARTQAFTKDMPALLLAVIFARNSKHFESVFSKVVDNGKMLRNFVQIVRSGVTGRKSFGSRAKKIIKDWLNNASDRVLIDTSIGNNPSLVDIIKMVHPKAKCEKRNNLFRYILGLKYNIELLPNQLQEYIKFNSGTSDVPKVPFQMLTHLPLSVENWEVIAKNMSWQQLRMNLNTLSRNKVFEDPDMIQYVSNKLLDKESISRSKVYPYQLLSAYLNTSGVPQRIRNSLQYAMEEATKNISELTGNVFVLVDVSCSMYSPVTGYRAGVTSSVSCLDAAAVMASAILRKCPTAQVIPFESRVVSNVNLNPLDSIMTNAKKLKSIAGGGTNCSCGLSHILKLGDKADLIIIISDNESWIDSCSVYETTTETMKLFRKLQKQNKSVKMVCIDITPNSTSQTSPDKAILNIGGFSDRIFDVIKSFYESGSDDHWVSVIEKTNL